MICREIHLPDRPPHWLLISQLEHARVSGVLAKRCWRQFDARTYEAFVQAAIHHDDGWADWEKCPQFDPQFGRPLSFHELPLEASLAIWNSSIEKAAAIGPLAGSLVAGHFTRMLEASEKPSAQTSLAREWLQRMTSKRAGWFTEWHGEDPTRNTTNLLEETIDWLRLLDAISLWLCGNGYGRDEQNRRVPTSCLIGESEPLETTLTYEQNVVRITPWRFDGTELLIEASGWLVPQQKYRETAELLANRQPHALAWRLETATNCSE